MPKNPTDFATAAATSLKGTSFSKATAAVKRRLIVAADAEDKSGKTHFALTAPGPIAYINTDMGLDGVVQKFQKLKEILVADARVPRRKANMEFDDVAEEAVEVWDRFCNDYAGAIRDPRVRTVVLDTGTEIWELLRLAKFGKLEQVKPHHYAFPNAIYRDMIREAEDGDKNLILIHKLKDEYAMPAGAKDGQRTGKRIRAGFGDTGYIVQVNVHLWKDPEEPFPDRFHVTVTNCRQNPEIDGLDLQGEMASFSQLAQFVFPDSKLEEWQ